MLYKIPVFNDVQYSCMKCCTLVCFALICRINVRLCIILVGVLYLILLYTSIATPACPVMGASKVSGKMNAAPVLAAAAADD